MPPKFHYHVTHPSIDAPPSAGSGNSDPTLLHPYELRVKPPDAKDSKRHKVNVESGLIRYLEKNGIPTDHQRYYLSKDGEGNTALTAGNVRLADLRRYYKWEFYSSLDVLEEVSRKALENIRLRLKTLYLIDSTSLPVLHLPKDWQTPENTQAPATLMVLQRQLDILPGKSRGYYKYSDRHEFKGIPYPEPNVTLHETRKDDPKEALRVEWTILKILAFPRLDTYYSELEVERHIGSNIAGFFNIENCTTSSNANVAFPTAIGRFGSFPRPDFACRLNDIKSSGQTIPSFRPVILAGEAKRDNTSILPTKNGHTYRMAAQLACTVQPTLVLLITDAVYRWEQERKTNARASFRFPFYSIIHGIAYDGNGVLIYAFFPRLLASNPDGRPSEWGFGCTVVSSDFTKVFHENPADRIRFIAVMLIIQRHATYLSEKLRSLSLGKCYSNCDTLWRKERLSH